MKKYDLTVCVIGLGYIGLPTAALLASKGYTVHGVDVDTAVVDTINNGEIHILEPDLASCVKEAVKSGKLQAFSTPQKANIYIICVPTPIVRQKAVPKPNLEHVVSATDSIISLVSEGDFIILESTSPIGTTEIIKKMLLKQNSLDLHDD